MPIDVELTTLRAQHALTEHEIERLLRGASNPGKLKLLRVKLAEIARKIEERE